jgi:amino acid permease
MVSVIKTSSNQLKRLVEIIETTKKVSRYLPFIVFGYSGLTVIFAVINILEHNLVSGIILCLLAGFGLHLTIRIVLTRRKWKRDSQTNITSSQK